MVGGFTTKPLGYVSLKGKEVVRIRPSTFPSHQPPDALIHRRTIDQSVIVIENLDYIVSWFEWSFPTLNIEDSEASDGSAHFTSVSEPMALFNILPWDLIFLIDIRNPRKFDNGRVTASSGKKDSLKGLYFRVSTKLLMRPFPVLDAGVDIEYLITAEGK
jgi:hypothetical protein